MPRGFRLPSDYTDDVGQPSVLWRPLQLDYGKLSRGHGYYAAALLAPGQTAVTATAELASIAQDLTKRGQYRSSMRFTAFAVPFDEEIRGPLVSEAPGQRRDAHATNAERHNETVAELSQVDRVGDGQVLDEAHRAPAVEIRRRIFDPHVRERDARRRIERFGWRTNRQRIRDALCFNHQRAS